MIVDTYEVANTRQATFSYNREREYTRSFIVIVDDERISPETVRLSPGLPRLWMPYISASGTFDTGVICTDITPKQRSDDPFVWDVEVKYSNKLGATSGGGGSATLPEINQIENPLLRPPEISWDDASVMVPMTHDIQGKPILNSAKQPFSNAPEIEETRLVLNVVRNQAVYDPKFYAKYRSTVNEDTFLGLNPGRWLCSKIPGQRQYENGVYFWRVSYTFTARFRHYEEQFRKYPEEILSLWAWDDFILDQGTRVLDANGKQTLIREDGMIINSPVLLNGAGKRLDPNSPPVYIRVWKYPLRKFKDLKIF